MTILAQAPTVTAPIAADCGLKWCIGDCDTAPGLETHYSKTVTIDDVPVYILVQDTDGRIDREVYIGGSAFTPAEARKLLASLPALIDHAEFAFTRPAE